MPILRLKNDSHLCGGKHTGKMPVPLRNRLQ